MPIIFNKKKNRYELNGKAISLAQIRREIQKLMDVSRREFESIGKDLRDGKTNAAGWHVAMKSALKAALLVAFSVGFGGRKQMTASQLGKLGNEVKKQNKYLLRLLNELESGKVTVGQIMRRSTFYANSIHSAYYVAEMIRLKESFTECRRIQNSREGCVECGEWADEGFVPIDEQPEIGSLICGSFCLCVLEYA